METVDWFKHQNSVSKNNEQVIILCNKTPRYSTTKRHLLETSKTATVEHTIGQEGKIKWANVDHLIISASLSWIQKLPLAKMNDKF